MKRISLVNFLAGIVAGALLLLYVQYIIKLDEERSYYKERAEHFEYLYEIDRRYKANLLP